MPFTAPKNQHWVNFRFYAELNDFLPRAKRQQRFKHNFERKTSIKDMIESLGVPHPEIELILVNGHSVDFSYGVQDGDEISVYPVFESFDMTSLIRLRPQPLRNPRFVLDVHLGRLASYLRLLGFDTLYRNDYDDPELAHISSSENRILLTRDRGLLKRSIVSHGYCLRTTDPDQQVVAVLQRFDLWEGINPFRRCIRCNGLLEAVDKRLIIEQLPAQTAEHYDEFRRCRSCEHIYWKGSHYERMQRFIETLLQGEREVSSR